MNNGPDIHHKEEHKQQKHKEDNNSKRKKQIKKFIRLSKQIYHKWHINHLAPIPVIAVYMFFGGLIFWWAENNAEFERMVQNREFNTQMRKELVEKIITNIEEGYNSADSTKVERRKVLQLLVDNYYNELTGGDQMEQQWTFTTGMYYSCTLFTTIGYGDIACETKFGQISTVIYSFIGIPLMLITLNELGKFLYKCINVLIAFLTRKMQLFLRKNFPQLIDLKSEVSSKKSIASMSKKSTGGAGGGLGILGQDLDDSTHKKQASPQRKMTHGGEGGKHPQQMTHFFKDQRIAQREIAFDYDFRNMDHRVEEHHNHKESSDIDAETGTLINRENKTFDGENFNEELIEEEAPPMHVLVAITFTVSWVLFCAALFKHVEEWSFGKSLYFVCISLLTVGLGDVKVARRDYMLLFFAYVMIGLSLVSMCINVIQNSIENFFNRLLKQMLENYAKGEGAQLGSNKLAKFLLPFLRKSRRRSIMRHIRDEAEKCGIEVPVGFEDINHMENIFDSKKEDTISRHESVQSSEPSAIEIQIQEEKESTSEEEDMELAGNDMLEIPGGWIPHRRSSFCLADREMQLIPFIDSETKSNDFRLNFIYNMQQGQQRPHLLFPTPAAAADVLINVEDVDADEEGENSEDEQLKEQNRKYDISVTV